MKRAILHIGTEKTGTTSIQKFLYDNRIKLGANGMLFPASAGYISNQSLVVYAKQSPEPDLAPPSLDVNDAAELSAWKEKFSLEHCAEVLAFQGRHQDSTLIYSAEHLQSRLTKVSEIKRLARLLRPLFDVIDVVVYLRRQDLYAFSAHSTSVRGGKQENFSFETINAQGPYYNYRLLLENWSEVFGAKAIQVRVFEKARLIGNDVVSDFQSVAGIDTLNLELTRPDSVNEALSATALCILREFNKLAESDSRLLGYVKSDVRLYLLDAVQGIEDSFGRVLPGLSSALAFYDNYKADNQWIADKWLNGEGFKESFDTYPEVIVNEPEIADLDEQLDSLISKFSRSRKRFSSRRKVKKRSESEPRQKLEAPKVVEIPEILDDPKNVENSEVLEDSKTVEDSNVLEDSTIAENSKAVENPNRNKEPKSIEGPKTIADPKAVKNPKGYVSRFGQALKHRFRRAG